MTVEPTDIKFIFSEALDKGNARERAAYLDQACGSNVAIRRQVEALIQEYGQVEDDFLESLPVGDCTVTLDKSLLPEGPGTVIGPYKLLEQIGEGGMAVVYMAEQERPLRRRVALKVIKLGMDTKQVMARFDAERQVLAMMDHPHIAKVLDAGATDAGRPYFVMELVRGVSITEYCDKYKLTTQERLELFVPVCNAVHHAHQKGIIHRDLKPSNIMVTMHDGNPVPMVIDFGIAKATNQRLTEQTVFTRYAEMIGTPEYMSPEQAEMSGLDIDTRADIYSLGIVLYELLTGVLPFDSKTLRSAAFREIQRIIREEEPACPSTRLSALGKAAKEIAARRQTNVAGLTKRLHRELEWIPMKAMRKDRTRRYRSASEFTDDIHNYLTGTPLIAGPESTFYRLQKFVRRYRFPAAVTTGIAAALIVGLVVSTSFYIRVKQGQARMARLESQIGMDSRLANAHKLNAEGDYQGALTEVEANLQEGKPDIKMRLLHAQLLFDLGRQEESEPILRTLLEEEPKMAAAHHLLARIFLQTAPDKAEEHRQLAESLQPRTADACVLRAMTADTPDIMIEWLSEALELEPYNYAALQTRALAFYGLDKFDRMRQDARVIVATRPKDSFGYALRALAKRNLGFMAEALKDHNRVIRMCQDDSESARYHSQRQETFFCMKDYRAALKDAEYCVLLDPDNLTYRVILGRALFATGQYERAAQEFGPIQKHRGFMSLRLDEIMLQFMSDLVSQGRTFNIPGSVVNEWPFPWLLDQAARYKEMAKMGTILVRQAYGSFSWSPDEKQLAYARSAEFWGTWHQEESPYGPNVGSTPRGIEILDMETGQSQVLVTRGLDPAWSPDGKYIAFVRHPSFFQRHLSEIWLIHARGGEPRRIAQGGYPCWSSDSERIYYHSYSEKALYCIDIEETLAKPQFVLDCRGENPTVSPDERYVADFLAGVLTIVERSSGQELIRWVVPGSGKFCGVQWSPDGNEISVCSYAQFGTQSGLWVFNLKEKQGWHVPVAQGASCNWSKDRTHIAIELTFPICEIWWVNTDPNLSTREALGLKTSRADYIRENWATYAQAAREGEPWIRPAVLENLIEMAANQYEFGQFKEAQWLLNKLDELHQALLERPHPRIVALTAKTLWQLGSQDKAQIELTRLRLIYANGSRNDEDILNDVESALAPNDALRVAWDQMARGESTKVMTTIVRIEEALAPHDQVLMSESIQSLRKALARAFVRRAKDIRHRNGQFSGIVESIEQALFADPNCVTGLRDLAWLQAVCPNADYRNGASALKNARKACELTDWKAPDCLTALAAAHGEAGEYDQAAKWQLEAIGVASEDICAGHRREMVLRLDSYQSEKHLHEERIKPIIARWSFDQMNEGILTDTSRNGNHAQLMGAARLAPDQGGSALLLGREGGYVECPNESAFDLRDEIAISCWIRADALTGYDQPIIAKGEFAWRLFWRGNAKQLAFHGAGLDPPHLWRVNGQKMVVDDGRWHHVVATFDGQRLYLYVDGALDASVLVSGKLATNNEPVRVGALSEDTQRGSWTGSIDEVGIHARSLAAEEIRALYEEGNKARK